MKEIECTITGRVQMVMYRAYVERKAKKFGLVGTVKNSEDGSVEVVAQGDETMLKNLIGTLKHGSLFSKVEHVAVTWKEPILSFKDFSIVY